MSEKNNIKVAVIDMNNGNPNQGMRGIQEILQNYRDKNQLNLTFDIFDIRQKGEVPDLNYDIYISSGGPGSPFDGEQEKWERDFFNLLDEIESFNAENEQKKYVFLICHSQPNEADFIEKGAEILAIEKERPHVDLERCIMAIRFSEQIIGTQFHPEADPVGMKMYLLQDEKKAAIIENHGEDKYFDMLNSLDDPDRITLTQSVILPNFLNQAIHSLQEA
ncbi:MAG: GMP synthase [Pedobacter sp.]|nr:MAG: GMP synthase [Pedobacter sp.]